MHSEGVSAISISESGRDMSKGKCENYPNDQMKTNRARSSSHESHLFLFLFLSIPFVSVFFSAICAGRRLIAQSPDLQTENSCYYKTLTSVDSRFSLILGCCTPAPGVKKR